MNDDGKPITKGMVRVSWVIIVAGVAVGLFMLDRFFGPTRDLAQQQAVLQTQLNNTKDETNRRFEEVSRRFEELKKDVGTLATELGEVRRTTTSIDKTLGVLEERTRATTGGMDGR